jgi:hypothetical protein
MANITIDGKEYDADALSDEAKAQLVSLQFCDMQLQRLQAEVAAMQTARMQYARALQEELQKPQNHDTASGATSGNSKDTAQAQPEKKKGLKGFFSKK